MKMVICFDTEDEKGMENSIKMMDHLAKEYMNRRIVAHSEASFGKIEFVKMLRIFATKIAEEMGLDDPALLKEGQSYRTKETWEGLRFAKEFSDKVYAAKSGNRRLGSPAAPTSLLK